MNELSNIENLENVKMIRFDTVVDKVYILCAAIWFKEDKIYKYQPKNIDKGFIVCGRMHHNCYKIVRILNKGKVEHLLEIYDSVIEGFLTNDDRFVDRKEGGIIAFRAGQIPKSKDCLFPEDLY